MRRLLPAMLLLQAASLSPASVLHWTTRLMDMECDNRPAKAPTIQALQHRPAESDTDTFTDFAAARPLPEGATLRLGVCGGDLRIVPSADSATLKITVHVTHPLPKDLTPRSYLQEFTTDAQSATMGWKLPENSHPLITVYLPRHANLDLQLGKGNLGINGIEGNKQIHIGKGEATLNLPSDPGYSHMTVRVAMGSFEDLRPGGHQSHKVPLKEDLIAHGPYTADIHVAMGKVILVPST